MDTQRGTFPAGTKILVVEDESIIAWDVEQIFRDLGAREILVAPSLRLARAHLAAHPDIGLVLIDLKLEDGSGAGLIDEAAAKGIPAVVTTGYDYCGGGRVPVVSKPYAAETLVAAALNAIKT
jgi:DNA-binding NtrC family response regulator